MSSPRRALLSLGLLALGCGRAATIHVVHPSPLSRWGREIGVARFEREGDADLSGMIAQGLDASPAFDLMRTQGQRMQVIGRVQERAVGPERVSAHPATCTRLVPEARVRTVPVNDGVRVSYVPQTVTEMVPRPYPCTELVRSVGARVRMHVRVNALTRPPSVVFTRDCTGEHTATTTGTQGSDDHDSAPPAIDPGAVLREADERAAGDFLDAVLPRQEDVEVEFPSCHDPRCDDGLARVRRGDLPGAIAVFTAAVDGLGVAPPVTPAARTNLAAALFSRGVVRGYGDALDLGIADVQRAIGLDATVPDWSQHLGRLQGLRSERRRTRFRGETRRLNSH